MKIRNNCLILLILLVVIAPAHLFSMPPQTGTWEPRYPAGVNSAQRSPALRDDADIEGTWNCLVILIDFEDYPWDNQNDTNFANTDAYYTSEHFDQMLFSEDNYQHPGSASDYTGSMHDYYREISSGVFETVGVITPWLRAPHP